MPGLERRWKSVALAARLHDLLAGGYCEDLSFYRNILEISKPVVEYGFGTGRLTFFLRERGFDLYGVEQDALLKESVRLRMGETAFTRFYLDKVDEGPVNAQYIMPYNVLFYLPPDQLYGQMLRLSRTPGARVVFDVDNVTEPLGSMKLDKVRVCRDGFSAEEIRTVIGPNRLRVERTLLLNDQILLKGGFDLWLHSSRTIMDVVTACFKKRTFYGEFNEAQFARGSRKLIALCRVPSLINRRPSSA
jgi:hypothetical protein